MEEKPFIIGLYGCYCHPFNSWDELNEAVNKKYAVGARVKHRCTGEEGVIYSVKSNNWYGVKYGDLPRDHTQEQSQNLMSNNS